MYIKATNLKKVYKGRNVVRDVSIEVHGGEVVGLLGPNGAGKTTSFYMIVGLVTPDEGKIFLGDKDITSMPLYERSRLGIGYLPQEPSVFRDLSVEDNIDAILETKIESKSKRRDRLEELLNEFSITHIRKNMGKVLSGGERRRTEMARALAADPKFILLDEPFAGVDPIAVEEMQQLVIGLKEKGIGVLITDHNVSETLSITDRTYLMFEGSVLRAGTAEELAQDEKVRAVYLGENFVFHRKKRKVIEPENSKDPLTDSFDDTVDVDLFEKIISESEADFKDILSSFDTTSDDFINKNGDSIDTISLTEESDNFIIDSANEENNNTEESVYIHKDPDLKSEDNNKNN